jgi:hypothetical protein
MSNFKKIKTDFMKMEQKWTELIGATFIFTFLCKIRNEYKNTKNKYKNRYFQK